ncbi:MAG: response regulator transcription factor [Maritimibacter sp.]
MTQKFEPRLALVEDDTVLRDSLMDCFQLSEFPAHAVGSAREFYQLLVHEEIDIAIIDIGLPDEDGFSIARFLRQNLPATGVIMLTARGTAADRVKGHEDGADIYLVKPVEYDELEAAIHSLTRRLAMTAQADSGEGEGPSAELWELDKTEFRVTAPNGNSFGLTNKETRLAVALVQAVGQVVSRTDLLKTLGYFDDEAGQRSLNAVIVRLRAKAEMETGMGLPIQAIRGQGYVLRDMGCRD